LGTELEFSLVSGDRAQFFKGTLGTELIFFPKKPSQKKSAGLFLTTECAITDIPEKKGSSGHARRRNGGNGRNGLLRNGLAIQNNPYGAALKQGSLFLSTERPWGQS